MTADIADQLAPAAENALRKLGKYDILGELGRGSFGIVYKAFDSFVQREVAVKIAHPNTAANELAGRGDEREAFLAEARAAGRLNHPYVVQLYDAGVEEGRHYIAMELVEGESLKRFCRKDDHLLSVERIANLTLKCALALDYVHKNGVLHKDIKPGNIMLTRDGAPKIMDFGVAVRGVAGPTGTRSVTGSPLYMSPEQIRGEALGPPADLYSLGTVLYQLLAGVPPFEPQEARLLFQQIKTQPPRSLRKLRRDLPEALYVIVERLLAKNAADRPQSGRELAEALTPLLDHNKRGLKRKTLAISHESLKQLHFFKAFESRELGELLDASSTATHKAGQTIIREGDVDHALYIVLAGIAEVRKGRHLVALLEKGDCFGEIGFLYAVKRTASVVATTDVLVLKVNSALLEQMPEDVQLRYYKIFCENLIIRLTLTTERAAQMLPKTDVALDFILP